LIMRKPYSRRLDKETFRDNVDVDPVTGCWIWKWAKNGMGYGKVKVNGILKHAHRVAFELFNGVVTGGNLVCHVCDRTSCVNPGHLFVGTWKDNMQDCKRKGRLTVRQGSKTGGTPLTDEDVVFIRTWWAMGAMQKHIAALFGVKPCTISGITNGRNWCHVVGGPL
jgi:hypothetical protein